MSNLVILPDLPRAQMFDKRTGIMSRLWQDFFRSLYTRVGGNESPDNSELLALMRLNQRTIISDDSVAATDGTVFIDATDGDITITMATAIKKGSFVYYLKRIDNSDNTVTLLAAGGEKIDLESSHKIYGLESISLTSDNFNWWMSP